MSLHLNLITFVKVYTGNVFLQDDKKSGQKLNQTLKNYIGKVDVKIVW